MDRKDLKEEQLVERQAKYLLISKDIPEEKKELVSSLVSNERISSVEKYRAIIELLKNTPDKVKPEKQPQKKDLPQESQAVDIFGPTETSYYIDSIYSKYKQLKIFKKRYLAHKNNRIGIGIKKRLLPGKRLMKIFDDLAQYQERVVSYLSEILLEILRDPAIESPLIFNYLRLVRKWLLNHPLSNLSYESIKWMERVQFDRIFREYIKNYFSFLKLQPELREQMILMVENKLRGLDELKKYEITSAESDQVRREKEKANLAREKQIYDCMTLIRSFLPATQADESYVSKQLNVLYGLQNLTELLLITAEGLVYQRPFTQRELFAYLDVTAPSVSPDTWDYSEDFLKKVGKDPASRKKKLLESLKQNLDVYESIYFMMNYDDRGQNRLMKAAEEQWKGVDKKRYEVNSVYDENFFNFLDALINFFKNAYAPFLNGTLINFRDAAGAEVQGAVFNPFYFEEDLSKLNSILNEMHFFKSNNPTLAVSRKEVKKIMDGQIKTMSHVEAFVKVLGDFFYTVAIRLQKLYDLHRGWASSETKIYDHDTLRKPISKEGTGGDDPAPIPYSDCTIISFEKGDLLSSSLTGKRVLDENLKNGVLLDIAAFAFQAAYECFNANVFYDLDQRKNLIRKLKELQ